MKQQDIAVIIVAVFVSGILSFFLSNAIFKPGEKNLEAAVVEPISTEFNEPSEDYFNDESINPTQTIRIGDEQNPKPFR